MKKKIIAVLVLALLVSTVSVFALGIGIQGGAGFTGDADDQIPGNVAITFKVDQSPLVFATNFYIDSKKFLVGLTGDYWISNANLAGPVNYFVGVGLGGTIGISDPLVFNAAARLPIGINAFFAKGVIEPYAQVVPMLNLKVLPTFTTKFAVDANVGIRFWF